MRTTIDRAGRVVIPKALRERAQLATGGPVEIVEHDGIIEISPAPAEIEIRETPEGAVAISRQPLPPLTDDVVRETLEHTRL